MGIHGLTRIETLHTPYLDRHFATPQDRRILEDTSLAYYSYGRLEELLRLLQERAADAYEAGYVMSQATHAWNYFESEDPR